MEVKWNWAGIVLLFVTLLAVSCSRGFVHSSGDESFDAADTDGGVWSDADIGADSQESDVSTGDPVDGVFDGDDAGMNEGEADAGYGDDGSGAWGDESSDEPPITENVRYVAISGPNRANDPDHGFDEAPWATLSYAVGQLKPGDTLMVRQGYYGGTITIDKSGTSAEPIVIRSEVTLGAKLHGGFVVNADHVVIYGFDIEQPDSGIGITIGATQGVEILNNVIHDCPSGGIRLDSASENYRIGNNTISYVGQVGIGVRGLHGLIDHNRILEVVAFHPKLESVDVSNGDDADGMTLRGAHHMISNNLIANYADPLDIHNYYPDDPIHNAHCDCFDTRELTDTVIDGNYCWSNFHVSKGVIFNGSSTERANITISNNIFEYRDIGISAYEYQNVADLYIFNNLLKSRIDDVMESWLHPGTQAHIPGDGIHLGGVSNYLVFNNITVDCDNNNNPGLTGNPIIVDGGTGISDYNFFWNSDGASFSGAEPGEHGSYELDPEFESYDTSMHGQNDYRLKASSSLLGMGVDSMMDTKGDLIRVTHDMNGQGRPLDAACEPGPFEYVPGAPGPASAQLSLHVDDPVLEITPDSCAGALSQVRVEIAKWPGDRSGAVVVRFDDSTPGHVLCGFDAFHSRNLTGTWYVNPGGENFLAYADMWAQAPAFGQELANHTMHHTFETDYGMWSKEVSDAADAIWLIRHGQPLRRGASLMGFCNSDSVAWDWTPGEQATILNEFENVDRQSYLGPAYPTRIAFSVPQGSDADTMYCASAGLTRDSNGQCLDSNSSHVNSGVPRAISDGIVYKVAFHGILSTDSDGCQQYTSGATDGGNGGIEFDQLETFLDYLVDVRDRVWIAGFIQVYKYAQEYQRTDVRMEQQCSDRVYFDLYCPLGPLFDEPLTLLVTVPDDWNSCHAMQGSQEIDCVIEANSRVMIDAVPNAGRVLLRKTG